MDPPPWLDPNVPLGEEPKKEVPPPPTPDLPPAPEEPPKPIEQKPHHHEDLEKKLSELESKYDSLKSLIAQGASSLGALELKITEVKTALQSTKSDLEKKIASSGDSNASAVAQVNVTIEGLKSQISELQKSIEGSKNSASRVLYFTSVGHPDVKETDRKVELLKMASYPITIITLRPEDTKVNDVPRIFVLPEEKLVMGASNVMTYLNLLVK